MTKTKLSLSLVLSLVCTAGPVLAESASKDERANVYEHDSSAAKPAKPQQKKSGPHGGVLQRIDTIQFETVLRHSGIQVYVYDQEGRSIDTRGARGIATLHVAGAAKRYRYDLFADVAGDKPAESLTVAADLTRIAGQQVSIDVQVVGLPQASRRGIRFKSVAIVPRTQRQIEAAKIAKQHLCPVSNQPLGSMGKPIAVTVGGQTIYVCCKGCVEAIKTNPAKYLAILQPVKSVRTTEADAVAVAAQKTCPVMDEPLDAMGGPWKTIVQGKIVYLCCPGCANKLHAEPALYFAKLAEQGVDLPDVK